MISETKAVKLAVAEAKRTDLRPRVMRSLMRGGHGRSKDKNPAPSGRSVCLGYLAWTFMRESVEPAYPGEPKHFMHWRVGYLPHATSRRLAKRVGKKLRQPHRRKDRGPRRARAAGKNNVRPSRGSR